MITPHWQQQLLKCEMVRASRSPHHRARASAYASRTVAKAAIPITNPNPTKTIEIKDPAGTPRSPSSLASSPANPDATAASMNHPSSTVAPISEAPRPKLSRPTDSSWISLDMGGIQIKSLPPTSSLFSFTFLTNLYLNHNALASVPAEISRLRHLELLDLSGNALTSLPRNMGMLTNLKELYLFDNHITSIPWEFGSLHQLQTLGIEGNPLDHATKSMVQKEGTQAYISYLRDQAPVPTPPPQREWILLNDSHITARASSERFSVLCYNILCERCATERLYGYTPTWALAWDYRREIILQEIKSHHADFLCLQEVDIAQYEDYFVKYLSKEGYEGVYFPKGRYKTMSDADRRLVDGCATFYNAERYTLVEKRLIEFSAVAMQREDFKKTDDMFNRVLNKDHISVVSLFEERATGTRIVLANAHIHWDPTYRDVKLVQVALLVDEIDKIREGFAKYPPRLEDAIGQARRRGSAPTYTNGASIPLIICGDFNSVPSSGVYEFLSTGTLPANHADFMDHVYGRYTKEGLRHRLGLCSAYDMGAAAGLLPLTNYTPSFQGVIDYIWYSTATLSVNAVLGEVDRTYLDNMVGFPNAHFPSDHLCLVGEFRVKPPREPPPRPPAPVFN
ncbi:hypothetical protein FISHEDRAFT_33376 [Fistulina hepatica ATCC 64428]|uniref:CCR4-Not complex 3'-5'-exoribonuclease subunit Ccr4 n=1 Tax=Fistulina hepatica ATCC 64428 TaxID=1128425 RepID=A0A0D7ANY2_9AGAR|nr:hypothetical protein FISHEDRAFT_33376 [Fistulina hepatica ATCC 64428]